MRFFDLLTLVMALLQREGRVSYRALKLEFALDDEHLEALRDELIHAKHLATDEGGRVLVWAGSAPATASATPVPTTVDPAISPLPVPPTLPPLITTHARSPEALAASADVPQPVAAEARPDAALYDAPLAVAARSTPDAERRQLTVMFCDLVDSTSLSGQLDAEDLRAIVRAYQETAAAVIQRFEGHIAQYLGDGLLVYFGYPQAHEDDARRAVHTGLGIVEAMGTLNTQLAVDYGVYLAVRIGVHTGPVVVGEMGGGRRHEHLALGETPNIAARLEGLAQPNTVVISPVTARLVRNAFVLEELGMQTLRGVATPMLLARVLGPSEAGHEDAETAPTGVPALVGRDEEIGLLLRRWEQSREGHGQVVLISGEAGIGKSSLVETLRAHVLQEGLTRATLRCSPYHTNSALYPVIIHVQQVLRLARDDAAAEKLAKLERVLQTYSFPLHEAVPLLAALLAVPVPEERYAPLLLTPLQQRQQTHDVLVAWMLEEAERLPVLMVWEDLHWADPSTLELLGLFIEQAPTAPICHLLTFRPEFVPPWPTRSHMTPLTLNRLERPQVETLIARLAGGKALPTEVVQHIVAKTDGVPLFVEELTKMLLEADFLHEAADRYTLTGPLATSTIPATLSDSLMARLDRLPTVREVAQLGAVIGREFAYEILQALDIVEESTLQHGLAQLVEAELLYQRGRLPRARYLFKHALIQDAAYASLLKSTRQQYHQQIAQLFEARFPETVAAEPELVAHHYTEAGCAAPAVGYWQQAGQRALQRSAHVEAMAHLQRGLALLSTLPETPARAQQELDLLTTLGPALLSTKGYAAPEVVQTYTRARELCQQLGETTGLVPVLWNLWVFYVTRTEHQTALELGEQCLQLAQRVQDAALLLAAHLAIGISWFYLGQPARACTHLEHTIALYDPEQHHGLALRYGGIDLGMAGLGYCGWARWLQGYPEQARALSNQAMILAQHLAHPYSLARMLYWDAILHQLSRNGPAVRDQAQAAMTMATQQGFALVQAVGPLVHGWAVVVQDQSPEGLVQIRQGLATCRAIGAEVQRPHFLAMLAEASGLLGQVEEGLAALDEALTLVEQTGERYYAAELHRLRGELLLKSRGQSLESGLWTPDSRPQTSDSRAEDCFRQALDIARQQQARSLELRAAMSLSRLWLQQGKRDAARALLAPIYDWFSEGFDTAGLREAKALLEALT